MKERDGGTGPQASLKTWSPLALVLVQNPSEALNARGLYLLWGDSHAYVQLLLGLAYN